MKRSTFITTTLLSFPAFACSGTRRLAGATSGAYVVRAGKSRFHQPTPFMGVNPNDLKVSSKDTGGRLSTFDYVGIRKAGPSLHAHLEQDEVFYVVDGEFVFQLGNEKQLLRTGDVIFLPRTIPHTWVQVSDKGQLYYFLQPAGKMEEFFLKMTEMGGKMTPEEAAKVNLDHGIKNYGPPLSPTDNHVLAEKLSLGFVVRAGEGRFGERTILNGLSPNDIKISGKDTGGELSIFEYTGNEKGGPPLHIHPHQDEVFYIVEGEYLFQCGEDRFTIGSGDMIFLPRGVPHAFAQRTDRGKMLFFFQPSGKMEDFFRAIGGAGNLATGTDPFKAHDMEVVGPPLQF